MTHIKQNTFAAVIAVFVSIVSLQAIVTVPPAQAQTMTAQVVELA